MNGVVLLKAQLFQIKPESRSKEPNLEFRGLEVFYLHGNEIGPLDKDGAIFFGLKFKDSGISSQTKNCYQQMFWMV